ncbi:hypothetical protein [Bacillus sp. 2SH]|uniref:hypothetical protein n=1 Tax=Bacillus sp. 2SH TaxID=2502202 RepID=UPI0010F49AF7|nr:hypothetical protein [Bacillus sp. 2SH]
MGKLEPFTGVTVTGQILKEEYTLNWRNQELIIGQKVKSGLINIDTRKWKQNISMVEILSEDSAKNVQSAVVRGVIGNIALGGAGALAGALSAKNDSTFNVIIRYHNGYVDLIECDIKLYTKLLQQVEENKRSGNSEFINMEYEAEEYKRRKEQFDKGQTMDIVGCGVILIIIIVIVFVFIGILAD